MNIPAEFDEIRPYTPEELPQVFDELLADASFLSVVSHIMPGVSPDILKQQLRQCKTNLDVQIAIFYPLIQKILEQHSDGFTLNIASLTDKTRNYTFISNHRDIVLDPGLLSKGLIDNKFPNTTEIAIGDNLLIYPWIKKLVRLNKAFIVQRSISMKQILESSTRMSKYIHFAITTKKENIWIAQREGRAKDSNDLTQESVLKMLAIAGEGNNAIDRLKELNIVPLALSYEYDPCDYLKAQEMQQKRDSKDFKKTFQDDLVNMQTGIFGYKGRIYFQTDECINNELEALRNLPKKDLFIQLAKLIDVKIHRNYHLYPGNYIAYDLLENNNQFSDKYTHEEKKRFEAYIQQKLDLILLPHKDVTFLYHCLLTMYANPVINHMKAIQV